jgi:Major Facilitator Superfamily
VRAWVRVVAVLFVIAYGANQFSPLMVLYREQGQFSAVTVAAFFAVYILGLAPGLLLGGPASDVRGRRWVLLPALVVSVPASAVLALGGVPDVSEPALFAGRFLFGAVTGVAMAVGTTWVKELSQPPWDPDADAGAGARRAALGLSAGFGGGPLVAGVLAQWAPLPMELPYLVHILITLVAIVAVLGVPETRVTTAPRQRIRLRVALPARFRWVVAPMAPWVFGGPSISFAVQPAALARVTGGLGLVFATLVTVVTLGAGVAVQPWARRIDRRSPALTARVGLAATVAGVLLAAGSAALGSVVLAVVGSAVLGAAYGLCLVAGLLEVQRMAAPEHLGALTAVYYTITYVGFLFPVVLAALTPRSGYPELLLGPAVLALVSLAVVWRSGRRPVQSGSTVSQRVCGAAGGGS